MIRKDYVTLKLAEELSELSELLLKLITKPNGANSPERIDRIVEETGDVQVRLNIFVQEFEIIDQVKIRISKKMKEISKPYKGERS